MWLHFRHVRPKIWGCRNLVLRQVVERARLGTLAAPKSRHTRSSRLNTCFQVSFKLTEVPLFETFHSRRLSRWVPGIESYRGQA